MGYTNIYEFGGINTWKGDIVTTDASDTANIWTASDIPISIRYDRMWEYSAYAESTDPELISALTEAIKALEIGEPTDMATEDFTDIVTFTFKDGSTLRYEFEDQNIVKEDGKRYQVDGLSSLRSILNNMIEEE